MALSSSQRIKNDVNSHEVSSDKYISNECYYVVRIELEKEVDTLEKFVKNLLKTHPSHPILGWCQKSTCTFLFSSVDEEHYMKGSHHSIISEFVSLFCLEYESKAKSRIIELESRTRVLVYFQTKIVENENSEMMKYSIKQKDIDSLTRTELVEKLKEKNTNWETIPSAEKFGTFFKYSSGKFLVMSEAMITLDNPVYTSYFFS